MNRRTIENTNRKLEKHEKLTHLTPITANSRKFPTFCHDCGFMFLPVQISSCLKPSTPMRATAWSQVAIQGSPNSSQKNEKNKHGTASNSCCMQFRINRSTFQRESSESISMKSIQCPALVEVKPATSSSRNASTSRCASINLRAVQKQQHFIVFRCLQYHCSIASHQTPS